MSCMKLLELPEGCISHILSLTSPKDVVRSSVVSKQFLSASESDSIWNKFLPSDCDHFISQSSTPLDLRQFASKKQLFFYLCRSPILFNNSTQSFGLDKKSGKKCFMLGARMLGIVWGDTPQYWTWKSVPESRFPATAKLRTVCWLHISGKLHTNILSSNTTYSVYFVFKMKDNDYRTGFEYAPVKASVSEVDEEGLPINNDRDVIEKDYYLITPPSRRAEELPVERDDGWMEIEMGMYQVECDGEANGRNVELEMKVKEINVLNWKSGLLVQGIELRPLD